MKLILTVLLLSIFSLASAQDYQVLVGGEFGQSKGEWGDYDGEWENSFGARIGVETEKTRIYLSYNYLEIDDFLFVNTQYESHTALMNFDAKTDKYYKFFRGFAGIHVGALYSKWDLGVNPTTDSSKDDTNLVYGGQAGLIIDIVSSIYLETGFKYSFTNASSDSINPADVMNYYGALNFKF